MSLLFEYPPKTAFGRVVPKNKIYEHGSATSALKEYFVRQVDQIVWQYKLAPETINIKATAAVPEIQVFIIVLKDGELKPEVLRCIDQAIPFPILYELHFEDRIKPIAAYKRPSEADASKWVLSEYFSVDWLPSDTPRQPLPVVFDLDALYRHLIMPLLPRPARAGEDTQALIARMENICLIERELERCKQRLRKENQFNRKVEIHAELRELNLTLENLNRSDGRAES